MDKGGIGPIIGLGLFFVAVGGWITHVIVCIATSQWALLIAGALCAPVGVIHGIGLWFGAW